MTTNTPTPYYNLTKVQQRILRQALSTYNNEQLKNLILGDGSFVLRESDVIKGLTDELKLSQSRHAKASALVGELKRFLEANGFAVEFENRNQPVKTVAQHAAEASDHRTDAFLSLFTDRNEILSGIPYFVDNGAGGFTKGEGSFEDFLQTIFGGDIETNGGTVTGRFPSPGFRTIDLGGGRKVDVLAEKPVNTAGTFISEAERAANLREVISAEIAQHPGLLDACLAVTLDDSDAEILGRLTGVSPQEAKASLQRVKDELLHQKAKSTDVDVDITINGATSEQAEVIRDALTTALQTLGLNGRSTLEAPKGKPTTIVATIPLPILSPLQINQCEVLFDEYVDDYRLVEGNKADLYLDSNTTFHQFALAAASCTNSQGQLTCINPEHFISYLVNHRG